MAGVSTGAVLLGLISSIPLGAQSATAAPAGSVKAWGYNAIGQLGDGTTSTSTSPVDVSGLGSSVEAVAGGAYQSLALKSDGSVWAWGYNRSGQLGDGTTVDRTSPVAVSGLGSGVVAIAGGGFHGLAFKSDGSVWAWGSNDFGQLGDGTTIDRTTPVVVTGLGSGVAAIAAGQQHSLALKADGSVWAWGSNLYGQLGDGTTINRSSPVAVSGMGSGIAAVAGVGGQSLALKQDGSVWAWGHNDFGQLGDGSTVNRTTPVAVSGLGNNVVAIGGGAVQGLAVKSDGSAWAWGYNSDGELGDGTTINRSSPVAVSGLSSEVVAVAGGQAHSVALKSDGSVWAWGNNSQGQLGDGTTINRTLPAMVSGLGSGVVAIAAGDYHNLALFASGPTTTAPASPTNVIAAAGDGMASVSWSAPVSDGGSPITGYVVVSSPDGQTASVDGTATTATVHGLSNGTSYSFTVTAANAIGVGPTSSASGAVVPQAGAQAATTIVPADSPGSATTDPGGGPTASTPLTTTVMVPATGGGGSVSIVQAPATGSPPSGGYQFVGLQVDIVSTAATSSTNPLTIVFTVDGSALIQSDGLPDASTVDITRTEGSGTPTVVPTCTTTVPALALDPCVASRVYVNGNTDLQVTVLTSSASRWNSVIKPVRVTVLDTGYTPSLATVGQGGILQWRFGGTRAHTATDSLGLGPSKTALFNSGPVVSGSYGYVFRAAGTYPYRSTSKGDPGSMTGSVAVPLVASPTSGGTTTRYTLRWASASLNGYVFDVRYRFKKASSNEWSDWKSLTTGQAVASGDFTMTRGVGTYSFAARLRNSSSGVFSQWSPEAIVVAS